MTTLERTAYGGQNMVGRLRRVLVRAATAEACQHWQAFGWRTAPDPARLAKEHEQLCDTLERSGVEVLHGQLSAHDLDGIYTHDPALVTDAGAVLLRPGKQARQREVAALAADLAAASVPVHARLEPPATAEGGDLVWLDESTLLVGRGYRTNAHGIAAVESALTGVRVVPLDLAHFRGPGEVFHLMSCVSLLDWDLALVYPTLAPVRLMELLSERGMRVVETPDEEYDSLGSNALALAPSVALVGDGNPITRRRLEAAGVDVSVYRSAELGKGYGGPTCLTRPLLRDRQDDS